MTDAELRSYIAGIHGADEDAAAAALKRQDALAKPPRSLGRLEDISVRLAGITGQIKNSVEHRRIIVFSSDNGVCAEGVASAPQSVTASQTINFTRAKTGMSTLAKYYGIGLDIINVGVAVDLPPIPEIVNRRIAYGTNDIAKGPAMTREQALEALSIGIERAEKAKAEGCDVIGIGEMGIGNTTTSSSVLCALTGLKPVQTVGRGGCITDEMLLNKVKVVETALAVNKPDKNDPVDVLRCVGGFDIAAMAGAFLGAAKCRLPVVIDGYISAVAALCAYRLCRDAAAAFFPSHCSAEVGYTIAMNEMGLAPYLNLDMRLGEGSGCPLAFMIMDAACAVMNHMATFEEADINDDYLTDVRREMGVTQ